LRAPPRPAASGITQAGEGREFVTASSSLGSGVGTGVPARVAAGVGDAVAASAAGGRDRGGVAAGDLPRSAKATTAMRLTPVTANAVQGDRPLGGTRVGGTSIATALEPQ
jgi:hypothetical protein